MKETVSVTGGSGGIGQALLEQLLDRYQVKALFRTKNAVSDRWEQRGCVVVRGDLEDEAALSELVKGTRLVFHCAALVTAASYEQAHAVNVEGTRRLARLAAAHGCRRFVHVSSVAVYSGAASESDYVEDTELCEREDMAVYGLTKLQAERALREVAQASGLEYVIVRPTSVYGPHVKSYTLIPVDAIRKGLPLILGDGRGLLDVVFVDEVARALLLAAHLAEANGAVFNIGHETVTFDAFYSHYSRMLNRPARHLPISLVATVVRLLRRARAPRLRELRRGAAFLMAMAGNAKPFPSAKARALLGYVPEIGLTAGMLKTELWLRNQSLIPPTRPSLDNYGPLPFSPRAVAHPTTEGEITQIVQIARQGRETVRAIGSLHSTCPLPYTDGICVVLDRYKKLLKVDGPLVTIQAGMTIRELNEALAALDLALPINGSITAQTVAGAISTGTHGGSVFYGSLSDCVESVRIVRADGSVLDIDRSQDMLQAVVVSVGLLGIISTVTFRCVPSFVLRSRREVRTAQQVLDDFDQLNRRSLYTCTFYFPITDEMEVLSIDRVENAAPGRAAAEPRAAPPPSRSPVREGPTRIVLKLLAWLLLRHNSIQRYFTRFFVGSAYQPRTDRSDRVLAMTDVGTSGRFPALLRDMEIAVPYEQARAAIALVRKHFQTTGKFPLLPIHIRCTAASDLWLSPAYKRAVCFLEFWQYPSSDSLFARVHELLAPLGYRFHWGKEARADQGYARRQYERWDDFVQLRERWDPQGMFLNGYLAPFFGRKGREADHT